MSEYQYYEFLALDRLLTPDEMEELRVVSSRGKISPGSYVNEYSYGDFKGNPRDWLDRYFDVFFYYANWGTSRLEFKVSAALLSPEIVRQYCTTDACSYSAENSSVIVSFWLSAEEPRDCMEDFSLSPMLPLRAELEAGDLRILYLGWLLGICSGECDQEDLEPPVPPGLKELTPALEEFAEFFAIDLDLIDAAAEASAPLPSVREVLSSVEEWVARLSQDERDDALVKILTAHATRSRVELFTLLQCFKLESPRQKTATVERRTVSELRDLVEKRVKKASASG